MITSLTDRELEIIGISLYKCEGSKRRRAKGRKSDYCYAIEFTNCDPGVIELFVLFLNKILKINNQKLKVELFFYKDHNIDKLKEYWSRITGISLTQFDKPILLEQKNSRYKPNPRGTCKLRYYSKKKFIELEDKINELFNL